MATTPKNNPERIRNTGKFQERVSEIRLSKPSAPKKVSAFEVPKADPEASTLEKVGQFIEDRPMLKNTLDFLNAIGGAPAANFAANVLDRELNLLGKKSDIPFVPSFYDAYEGTKKYVQENFENRPLGTVLKAIPAGIAYSGSSGVAKSGIDVVKGAYAFGAGLRGIDPQTSKFLAEEAAKQYPKTATGLGLTFDLTADASNLFALGSGSVAKAGAKAAQKTAMKVAKDAGVKVSKKDAVSKVADAVYNKKLQDLTSKSQNLQVLQRTESVTDPNKVARDIERITRDAIRRGIDPEKAAELARKSAASAQKTQKVIDRAETLAQQAKQKAQKKISDASRAAQAKAQNALISLDIPFTKFTMPLINKPKAFQKTYDTVGEEGIRIVKQLFTPPAGLDEKQIADFNNKVSNFLAETYGTSDPRKLTVEEIRDLQSRFERANITPSTTFDIEKKYVENIVDDIRKVESTNPFLFDEFLKTYSPETQQIAMGMLREGMTPQDIINQLPDILRQYAETAGKRRVVPPQTEPLPKNIGDMLDELYYYDELSGRTTAPYEEVFNNILRLYNDPNVSRENLTKSLEETLQRARQSANEAEQTRFARETQEAQRIASENARLKTEFDEATRQYNIAFQNFKNSKATAKTDAEKAQTAQYEKLLKEWEDEVARLKAEKAKAKKAEEDAIKVVEQPKVKKEPVVKEPKKVVVKEPKKVVVKEEKPKPEPKTPYEQAINSKIPKEGALLVDEYAHFLKLTGKSEAEITKSVSGFVKNISQSIAKGESPKAWYDRLSQIIADSKKSLSSGFPTGKKVSKEVSGDAAKIFKPYIDAGMSSDVANIIQEISLYEAGLAVKGNLKGANFVDAALSATRADGKGLFIFNRKDLLEQVKKAIDNGASQAEILDMLKPIRTELLRKSQAKGANISEIRDFVKSRKIVAQDVDELAYKIPKEMEYKPPQGVVPAKPKVNVKRPEGIKFKKPTPTDQELMRGDSTQLMDVVNKRIMKDNYGVLDTFEEVVAAKNARTVSPVTSSGLTSAYKFADEEGARKVRSAFDSFNTSENLGFVQKGDHVFVIDLREVKDYNGKNFPDVKAINEYLHKLYPNIVAKPKPKVLRPEGFKFKAPANINNFEGGKVEEFLGNIFSRKKKPEEVVSPKPSEPEKPVRRETTFQQRFNAKMVNGTVKDEFGGDYNKYIDDLVTKIKIEADKLYKFPKASYNKAVKRVLQHRISQLEKAYDAAELNNVTDIKAMPNVKKIVSDALQRNRTDRRQVRIDKKIRAEALLAEERNIPFKDGEVFTSSKSVPKNIHNIVEQWKNMMGINERIHLAHADDLPKMSYSGAFKNVQKIEMKSDTLGFKIRLSNGDFLIVYRPQKTKQGLLETLSHEIGHALMDTRYADAPESVRKAIDDEFNKWYESTAGKTTTYVAKTLRPYRTSINLQSIISKEGLGEIPAEYLGDEYWLSKSEWFADQVAKWATTSEKPLTVVEKFFARLAKVMKQFFQSNKQYLASKTMEDWLNGLEESSKVYGTSVPPKPIVKTPEKPDIEYSKSNIEISSGNINIELPKRPKKKDIPLVIEQIEKVIKPTRPVYQKVPKVEPPKAVSLPTAKRNELRKLRENLQPTAKPEIINGLDRRFVSELKKVAAQLEKQKPEITTSKPENLGKMDIGTYKVKGKGKRIYRKDIPFYRLRQEGAFQRGATAVGPLSRLVRENKLIKMFSTRSLGTGNALVDSYGALLQDAGTRVSGESRFIRRDLKELVKKAEGLSPEQMKSVQYVVENRFPKAMTDTEKQTILDNTQIQEVADLATKLMAYIGKEDQAAGIVQNLRKDYFPHLMKFDADRAQEFADRYLTDPDLKEIASNLKKKTGFSLERRGLPTLAEYDDLVEELIKKRDAETDPTKIEEMDRKIEATTNLFNRDTVSVLNSRIYQSVRGRAMKDLYKQLEADGMIRYTWQRPENYVEISEDQAKILGYRPKTQKGRLLMHRDILAGMEQVSDIFTDQKMNTFVQTMDDIMRVWKLGTTVLIPKHYLNNLIGNAFNNGLAGVKVKSYSDALSFLRKMSKNQLSPEEQKMALQLYRDGVIGQGINAEFRLPESMTDRSTLQRLADWAQNTWYGRNVMHIGEAVDDWSRLALYMHMSKYSNSHQAGVDAVREYLFNYHEVTRADRFVRSTMMPFWLWMKNNIPLQVEKLLQQPRYFVAAEKIREATFEDDELQEKPEYIREKGFNLFGHDYVISLPMYDLYMVNGAQGTLKNILNSFGPLQTAIPELALNKDVFTSAPISKDVQRGREEDYTTTDIAKYLARQFGGYIGGEAVDYYQNVVEKERLTSAEQLERSLKGVFAPKPILEQ